MREILFRGKRIDNGEWVEGFYAETPYVDGYGTLRVKQIMATINKVYVLPETVGQYTGLNDKNGLRIFEGDVIENRDDEGCYTNFVIEWINQEAGFFARYIDKKHGENLLNLGDYKAIGNIHDNPELLEV